MKLYIIAIALVTGAYFEADAQQQVQFSVKYLPQHHYTSKFNMNVSGTVNVQGISAIADSMKAKGLPQNTKLVLNASGNIDINTGSEAGGMVPVTMQLQNIVAHPSINGQQIPFVPTAMLEGKRVYAKASEDGKLHIDSVSGKHLPDSTLNNINSMMAMVMSKVQLQNKAFKLGDSFTQTIPFNFPVHGLPPLNATTKVTYHLVKITGNNAYFDLSQDVLYKDDNHDMNTELIGSSKGTMVYEIKEHYPSAFQSVMHVNVHSTGKEKGGVEAMFTIDTNGTTSFNKE